MLKMTNGGNIQVDITTPLVPLTDSERLAILKQRRNERRRAADRIWVDDTLRPLGFFDNGHDTEKWCNRIAQVIESAVPEQERFHRWLTIGRALLGLTTHGIEEHGALKCWCRIGTERFTRGSA